MALDQPDQDREMSFFDHLDVLRKHLFRALIWFVIFFAGIFAFKDFVFGDLIFGPTTPDFLTFRLICQITEAFCLDDFSYHVTNMEVMGKFMAHIKISLILALIASFPFITYQLWGFIQPALYATERKQMQLVMIPSTLLFYLGCAFGYFLLFPVVLLFMSGYSLGEITDTIRLESYTSVFGMLVMATGIIFQLPVAVYLLSKLGLVSPAMMREYRRHAFIVILVMGAIITPPDVISQMLIALPIWILYEISIFVSASVYKADTAPEHL